jgi:hypothetical protein
MKIINYRTLNRRMSDNKIISWLLDGDISIQYQVYRDIFKEDKEELRKEIHKNGWASLFLQAQNTNGHWGIGYYQPKWTSTHYSLLQLRNLWIQPEISRIQTVIGKILNEEKGRDGGINPSGGNTNSDVCINGMFLNYASYFRAEPEKLESIIDYIFSQTLPDGGYNCQYNRKGAVHSSLHSTISVLEGLREYYRNGYKYRIDEVAKAEQDGQEFILQHRLFKSDKTGKVIKDSFLRFPYPHHWYYDILRALDYFRHAEAGWDNRMNDAMDVLLNKRKKEGYWVLNAKYPGREHFSMETAGKPSRWNTLRALRVLAAYELIKGG